MFGLGIENKTKKIIENEFDYKISNAQNIILKDIVNTAKSQNLNEYDAAIMFILVQINSVIDVQSLTNDIFIKYKLKGIEDIIRLAKTPKADIKKLVNEIKDKRSLIVNEHFSNYKNKLKEETNQISHQFTESSEVPLFDKSGRVLILKHRIKPEIIETMPKETIFGRDGKEPLSDYYLRGTAELIIKHIDNNIQNWEIGYTQAKSWDDIYSGYPLIQYFETKGVYKPFGYSKSLREKTLQRIKKIDDIKKNRFKRAPLIEVKHPYKNLEDIPIKNEIGYWLVMRSVVRPEIIYFMFETLINQNKTAKDYFKPEALLNINAKHFEIGYFDEDVRKKERRKLGKYSDQNFYNSEHTLKPFGFSETLVNDAKEYDHIMSEFYQL